MSNQEFLQNYQKLQRGIVYDKLFDLGFALIGYCQINAAIYWNNALIRDVLTDDQLKEIEKELTSLNRKPTLYFDSARQEIQQWLNECGYQKSHEDAWLFWQQPRLDMRLFNAVKKVESEEDLATFSDTFDACYQDDDPQNPYGNQKDYLPSLRNAWMKNHTIKLDYFLIYNHKTPVGVASLTSQENIGYISNVGTIREVRGQGFGKAITLFCVQQSLTRGNEVHALATEQGEYPYEFYKRLGFEHRFSATGYTK